jgi:hydroxymethylbilane synthase
MSSPLRIGTRDSELALWQARTVQEQLQELGQDAELLPVKSTGDLILDKPLYELGITGIFTKTLDVALLKGEIDLAVHSMKDVPTALPVGVSEAAVLPRANPADILVHKGLDFLNAEGIIATGSLRRKAQWLRRYPLHEVEDLRGNVNTRLQKLAAEKWDAAIFAAAGLERIGRTPEAHTQLDWMLPAPAQGAMLAVARSEDQRTLEALKPLNDPETALCVRVEREFLRELEGGCTAPIGALALVRGGVLEFRGALFALDGSQEYSVNKSAELPLPANFGRDCARDILQAGGAGLLEQIRKTLSQ